MLQIEEVRPTALDGLVIEHKKLRLHIEAVKKRMSDIERAIEILSKQTVHPAFEIDVRNANPLGARRLPLSRMILEILRACPGGQTLTDIESKARAMGIEIKSSSAAVMLSRLKKAGAVQHEGRRYRISRSEGGEASDQSLRYDAA